MSNLKISLIKEEDTTPGTDENQDNPSKEEGVTPGTDENQDISSEEGTTIPNTSGGQNTAPKVGDYGFTTSTSSQNDNINNSFYHSPVAITGIITLFIIVATAITIVIKRSRPFSSFRLYSHKKTVASLLGVAIIAITAITINLHQEENTQQVQAASDSLALSVDAHDLSITPTRDGAFGYTYHDVTVTNSTNYGYSLSAYATSANLINEKDQGSIIQDTQAGSSSILAPNTWGVSTTLPANQSSPVWSAMPTTSTTAKTLKNTNSATTANDTTRVYYGINVNTDLAYGDYTNTINYTAVSNVALTDLTFRVGEGIETIIVADSSENYKPFYATGGNDVIFTNPTQGTKYIVTVVPKANYKLNNWSKATSAGNLADETLLTTTYTAGNIGETLIATGTTGSYASMQNFNLTSCTANGNNVTDVRNGKSYTVAKFGNYCYMLSNLRLDGNTQLTTATSNVATTYTLPSDAANSGWVKDFCQPHMITNDNEYFYNWPAATARNNNTSGPDQSIGCQNDTSNSVGDICPANWSLPTYEDLDPRTLYGDGSNPSMLTTTGYFTASSQMLLGSYGHWWSSSRYSDVLASALNFNGSDITRIDSGIAGKGHGYSVRCMHSN